MEATDSETESEDDETDIDIGGDVNNNYESQLDLETENTVVIDIIDEEVEDKVQHCTSDHSGSKHDQEEDMELENTEQPSVSGVRDRIHDQEQEEDNGTHTDQYEYTGDQEENENERNVAAEQVRDDDIIDHIPDLISKTVVKLLSNGVEFKSLYNL